MKHVWKVLFCLLGLWAVCGCDVKSGPRPGKLMPLRETRTKRKYFLYLPKEYTPAKRWPLVVTLHGMKPFDNAHYQINEWLWRGTADKYGYIVVAPFLLSPDLLGEFPLRNPNNRSLKRDERAIRHIISEVCRSCAVDTDHILLTSWSSGGYILHYILNRYPTMFFAAAARESNFNAELLDRNQTSLYDNKPIYIYYGENDFAGVKREAIASAKWYRQHRFSKLKEKQLPGLGHQRRPDLAAEFFASAMGPAPKEIEIVASPPFGWAPLMATFAVKVPPHLGPVTECWWLFGEKRTPVMADANAVKISKLVKEPGRYPVEVIVKAGGKRYRSETVLTVEKRPAVKPNPGEQQAFLP